jgi:cysteine desulfurase/selenocysteine lyase
MIAAADSRVCNATAEMASCATFLDSARCSLLPADAVRAIVGVLEAEKMGDRIDLEGCVSSLRQELAGLIGAAHDEVAITQSASHSFNTIVNGLRWNEGDNVVVTDHCYRSTAHALLRLRDERGVALHVAATTDWRVQPDDIADLVDERTRLVIVEHVPLWCGVPQPVEEIGRRLRESAALFVVDAAQSAGQLPLDVIRLHCAFLLGTSRKWLRGPRGVGFLYVAREFINTLRPEVLGYPAASWTSTDSIALVDGIDRLRVADQAYASYAGLTASVAYARALGIDMIAAHNAALGKCCRDRLHGIDRVVLYDYASGATGTVPFNIRGVSAVEVAAALERAGIRVSVIYAENARFSFERLGVESLVRVSLHAFNDEDDIDRLVRAVCQLAHR